MWHTLPGTPCLYYGTEIALRGREEWENRSCMPWEEIDAGVFRETFEKVSALIALRRSREELKGSRISFRCHSGHPRLLNYTRSAAGSARRIGVCVNCESTGVLFPIGGKVLFANRYKDGKLEAGGAVIYEI